jgi:integrase
MTRGSIIKGRDRRAATPAQARHFMETVRKFFEWALEAQHVQVDSTAGVKNPKSKKTGGWRTWTEAELQQYERRWKPGTRQRMWSDVLQYSGLRRGDAVRLGRQHVQEIEVDGRTVRCHVIKIQKAGYLIEVTLPILPAMQEAIDRGPTGDLAYIVGERGHPLTKESFGNEFADACREAKVPGRAHGLRKLGATRAANSGATDRELQALFGWTDYKMPAHYTRDADRRRLGVAAGHKLAAPETNKSAPAMVPPAGEVRPLERKK